MTAWTTRASLPLTLRTRFLLVVFLGVILPLAVVGIWLTGSTRSSGEALLRSRLGESLRATVEDVGYRWVDQRAALLRLAENPAVRDALRARDSISLDARHPALDELRTDWQSLDQVADRAVFRDNAGIVRGDLRRPSRAGPIADGVASPVSLPVRLLVTDPVDGNALGSMEVSLRLASLLPAQVSWAGIGGSVLALFDSAAAGPLLPVAVEPSLLARDRFVWGGEEWLVVSRASTEPPLRFTLAAPIDPFVKPFSAAARRGSIALAGVLLGSFLLAVLLTRRITGPLEQLADGADDVAAGHLERTVREAGPDEIRRVGRAFNTMTESLRRTLDRLSQREAVAAVGEFAASLAHEVRNPLMSLRLDVERASEKLDDPDRARELLTGALREIDRLDQTVRGSLRIARSGDLALHPIDLCEPVAGAWRTARPRFDERGAHLAALPTSPEPARVLGDAAALEQLFLNLLLNAADALDAGGSASVSIETSPDTVRVAIRDDGKSIAPEVLERVFEPFFSTTPGGTGLGLAISRRIAAAHGGELRLESTPGAGAIAHFTLPRLRETEIDA